MPVDINAVMDCITHPVKSRLFLAIHSKQACSAKELGAILQDIPQATLYRALNSLQKSNMIQVVEEHKVRALTEKIYAVNAEVFQMGNPIIEKNDGAAYARMFAVFVMELMREFQAYADQSSINILEDGSGFSSTPIYATTEELAELGAKVNAVIAPYQRRNSAIKGQRVRNLATIITPPTESMRGDGKQ